MKTRFAPSPTGLLHLGNARTALVCYLYAKKSNGEFILRFDDTDIERCKPEYIDSIKQDLEWLGLEWDRIEYQSKRIELYHEAAQKLKDSGRLYSCYETAEELEIKRKMQLSRGLPPIYDREGLKLTKAQKSHFEKEGRKPHYRFLLEDENSIWNDEIRGEIKSNPIHTSDPILIRQAQDNHEGLFTYMLPSTVDDIDFNITNVLRGEDHITNTAIQIQIFSALLDDKEKLPNFAHMSLVKTKDGKLSKRDKENKGSITAIRRKNIFPLAINSFLAKIGTSDSIDVSNNFSEILENFSLDKFNKAPTIYEFENITRLNTKILHHISFADVKPYLIKLGLNELDENFWLGVRGNIENISETKSWWNICKNNISSVINSEDKKYLEMASSVLPEGVLNEESWSIWIKEIKKHTDRKGKSLFMPIRKALTSMEQGPELKNLLPLIGRDLALKRLKS